ncbi:hypothetical protein H2200_008622 [Cladophialophora chaetospira]|uniref:Zn(2)-C6 fungal-type domain-containing protein n=1 Tax=Cladophialophora chaetospira TaxID=386627 RepID=A0AA38X4D5_9EURO|nr:hypothetical protein H2200_008622 [Cladophialophora chaetospira]
MENWSSSSAVNAIAIAPRPTLSISSPMQAEGASRPRNSGAPSKRKRIACKECRQGKLKCESTNLQKCSRCNSLDLSCVYDNDYQRYNKRVKLRELTDEVERLRAEKAGASNQPSPSPRQQDTSPSQQSAAASDRPQFSHVAPAMHHEPTSPALLTTQVLQEDCANTQERCPALYPRRLSNTCLSAAQVTRLFQTFSRDYRPHVPILEAQIPPDDCFVQSPLLFWTIIAIASRKDDEEPTILASLAPAIKSLLWQTIGNPPHSRADVKAMILICLWPFPTSSMSTDPSYILAATSQSSAMHIGLHRPHFAQDFARVKTSLRPAELKEAAMLWSACFIAAESTTSITGQQPLFVADATLDKVCNSNNSYNIPLNMYHLILIWRFCNRLHRVMAKRERRVASLGENDNVVLLPLFEGELDQLRQQLGSSLSRNNQVMFLYASLQLRCYHFLERHSKMSLQEGILKAYRAALYLIQKSQEMESEARLLSYGPIMYSHAICLASTFALKILRSSYSTLVDAEEGRKVFNLSLGLLRKCSVENNDLSGRFSKILTQLWSATPEELSPQNELKVTTRLSGSLLHDTLWKWREKFGGQSPGAHRSQASPSVTTGGADSSSTALARPDLSNGHDNGMVIVADASTHNQSTTSTTVLGQFAEIDLVGEINNDWLWGDGGLSSLMAMDLDDMDFPLSMGNNYPGNGNQPDTS